MRGWRNQVPEPVSPHERKRIDPPPAEDGDKEGSSNEIHQQGLLEDDPEEERASDDTLPDPWSSWIDSPALGGGVQLLAGHG